MRQRQSTIVLFAAAIAACGDSTAPTRDTTLSFCSGTGWAGVQNEGGDWVTIANGPGDVTEDATERLVVATITGALDAQLTFYYLTRDQAQATFVCAGPSGTKELTVPVTGTTGGEIQVSIARSGWILSSSGVITTPHNVTVRDLPDGPLDLVATYEGTAIVRRRLSYPNGATIPVVDFSSAEAISLQSHTLAVEPTGLGAARWQTWVMTNGGTLGGLTLGARGAGGTIHSLPASYQESGDLYRLLVATGSVGAGDLRFVERFYDTPSNQTVVFGPPVASATFTTVATAGQVWRAEIPSQPEYGSQIELLVSQPLPPSLGLANRLSIVIRASKEYFGGTPATWAFTIPDLSSVAGFPAGWQFVATPQRAQVTASDAPWAFSPSGARAGDAYRRATRF
jgi:hypothetical protein